MDNGKSSKAASDCPSSVRLLPSIALFVSAIAVGVTITGAAVSFTSWLAIAKVEAMVGQVQTQTADLTRRVERIENPSTETSFILADGRAEFTDSIVFDYDLGDPETFGPLVESPVDCPVGKICLLIIDRTDEPFATKEGPP